VRVRDTKYRTGLILNFQNEAWREFTTQVKAERHSTRRLLPRLVHAKSDLYGRSRVTGVQDGPQRPSRRKSHCRDILNAAEPPPASYLLFESRSHSGAIAVEPFRGIGY
jgi:hypothetical protein